MKPLKLIMTAFGPFAASQEVDFSELGERSFFLIHGPTGSGKTTILDAICFVLYGDSSGGERSGEGMRSDFAPEDMQTEVSFVFALGDKVYRVWRKPRQSRPAKRGGGMTTELQAAELHVLGQGTAEDLPGVPIASGWSRVSEEVEKILGFRSDQFRQVVMLPQGQFRKLLMADSKERQAILETLFRTGIYTRIEAYFKQEAIKLKGGILTLREKYSDVLHAAECENEEKLQERIIGLHSRIKEQKTDLEQKQKEIVKAQEEVTKAKQVAEKLQALEEAQQEAGRLAEQREEIEKKKEELLQGRRALPLIPVEGNLKIRRSELLESEEENNKATMELEKIERQKAETEVNYKAEQARELERKEAEASLLRLQGLSSVFEEAQKARDRLEVCVKAEKEAWEGIDGCEKHLAKLRADLENRKNIWESARELAGRSEYLGMEVKQRQKMLDKSLELQKVRENTLKMKKQYLKSEKELQKAQERFRAIKRELSQLQEAWAKGQAAILARGLQEGTACPVCGATDHPAPMVSQDSIPGENDLQSKQYKLTQTEEQLEKIKEQFSNEKLGLARLEDSIRHLEDELGEDLGKDINVLQSESDEFLQQHEAALKAAQEEAKLAEEIGKVQEEEKKMLDGLESLKKVSSQAQQDRASSQGKLEELNKQLPKDIKDLAALQVQQRKAGDLCQALAQALEKARTAAEKMDKDCSNAQTRAAGLLKQLEQSQKQLGKEEEIFVKALKAAGFAAVEDFREAQRAGAYLDYSEQQISEYDSSLRSAQDQLKRCKKEAQGLSPVDIEAVEAHYKEVLAAKDLVYREQLLAEEDKKNKESLAIKLKQVESQLKSLEEEYRVLGSMSDVANGKNPLGITFQRFVLGALLDDVIIAATERLKKMSRGRFLLQRTLERSRANAAGGLNIEVYDNYTGTTRPVENLSGGESFLASLSLALGLAEVVQSYSGGTHLDAMFIDEGFGSLDADSLDYAIKILIDLHQQGRLVGIISHIEELKERIDARLEIQASDRGSTARFHVS